MMGEQPSCRDRCFLAKRVSPSVPCSFPTISLTWPASPSPQVLRINLHTTTGGQCVTDSFSGFIGLSGLSWHEGQRFTQEGALQLYSTCPYSLYLLVTLRSTNKICDSKLLVHHLNSLALNVDNPRPLFPVYECALV